ncbi:MAG: PEGA domain-containing protein [Acidobacteria bacterium]|nr:PEGA domain-containing protein [Acidobacteriota bacterium]
MQSLACVPLVLLAVLMAPHAMRGTASGNKVAFVGGTMKTFSRDMQGHLILDDKQLLFSARKGAPLRIPYHNIRSLEFGRKVGRMPEAAIVPGAAALDRKKHFLTIRFVNASGENEGVVLEIAQDIFRSILPVLQTRTGKQVVELVDQPKLAFATRPPKPKPVPKPEAPQQIAVRFTSTPAGADVLINGEFWGSTPTVALTRLPAGTHTVVVRKSGYSPWQQTVTLAPGDERTIMAELALKPYDPTQPRISGN